MDNIAIIITKLNGGGAERVASNLSIELSEFFNVKLIVFDCDNQTYSHGGELFDLELPQQSNILNRTINVWKRVWKVRKIKKQENVVCSISLLDGPNIVNLLSKGKDKVIVSVRNLLSGEHMGRLRKLSIKLVSNHSDKLVALSKMVQKDLADEFGVQNNRMTVIYNSCDRDRLWKLANGNLDIQIKFDTHCKYVVTIGRLMEQKGQWHLIRAFRQVVNRIPNVKLLILGDGNLRKKLETLVSELRLTDNVIFAGYVNNPHGIIRRCDVFAFPSLFEGLGNVLLEALAFGKAIVSTDCDAGPREILAPNTPIDKKTREIEFGEFGILVPVGDREHFSALEPLTEEEKIMANAICMLLTDDKMRLDYERKALTRNAEFAPHEITRQWSDLIRELI